MTDENNNDVPKKIRIAPEEIEIGDEEGFEGHDLFGYAQFGNTLANIFQRTLGLRTFLLDDEWGSGKTVFVKQWAGLLRQRKAKVVYIDAFENDYQSDPFLMLVTEITNAIGSKQRSQKLVKAGAKALETVLTDVTKSFTLGTVNLTKIADAFEEQLNAAEKEKKSLENFREELGKTAQNFDQLVVIVDELDRCRPDFALRLLERVKHLFDVEGVSFLLVASSNTLVQMVRHAYGFTNEQAVRYLDKFINLRTSLPKIPRGGTETRKTIYTETLAKNSTADDRLAVTQYQIYDSLGKFTEHCGIDLRTIEKIYFSFVAVCASDNFDPGWRSYVISLCIVKIILPRAFQQILKNGTCDWADLSKKLNIDDYELEKEQERELWPIFHILIALFSTDEILRWSIERENPYAADAFNKTLTFHTGANVSRDKLAKWLANLIEHQGAFS